jgi:hypothetical protein
MVATSDKDCPDLPRDSMVVRRRSNTEHNHNMNDNQEAMAMMTIMKVPVKAMEDNTKSPTTAEGHLLKILMDAVGGQCPVLMEGQFLDHRRLTRIVINSDLLLPGEVPDQAQVKVCQVAMLLRMVCAQAHMPRIRIPQVSPIAL